MNQSSLITAPILSRVLLALLLGSIAVSLRLINLGTWDLWTDELHTIGIATSGVYTFGPAYITAPLNFVFTGWMLEFFGEGEVAARLVPLSAGVLTVVLVFQLTSQIFGLRAGILSGLLLTLLPWHIYWSQTARHFSLVTLALVLAIIGISAYWRAGARWGVALAIVGSLLSMFTHSSAAFYVAASIAFFAGWLIYGRLTGKDNEQERRRAWRLLWGLSAALALYVPILVIVGLYAMSRGPWNPWWNIAGSFVFYLPPWLALTALGGGLYLSAARCWMGTFLLTFATLPVLFILIASNYTTASASYGLPSAVAVIVLAGVGFDRLLTNTVGAARQLVVMVMMGMGLALLADVALYYSFYRGYRPPWRAVAESIVGGIRPEDAVIAQEADVLSYYLPAGTPVAWFSAVGDSIARGDYRGPGEGALWIALYAPDRILPIGSEVDERIRSCSRLIGVFPAHYGPKDRTLLLYRASREERDNCFLEAAPSVVEGS